jgi:hypothetical protein
VVLVTAGLVPGLAPLGYTKIWKAGPEAGAGAHWYAQPRFHGPLATVNDVLVHVPLESGVGPNNTATEPDVDPGDVDVAGVVVVGAPPDAGAVVDDEAADDVVVVPDVVVVLWLEPLGTGNV